MILQFAPVCGSQDGSEQLRRRPKNRPFLSCFHGQNLYTSSRASQHSRQKCSAKALTAPAGVRSPRPENVAGDFFVDHTCIDCDTCRWMAPEVFSRIGDMSAVHHQPGDKEERLRGLQVNIIFAESRLVHYVTLSQAPFSNFASSYLSRCLDIISLSM